MLPTLIPLLLLLPAALGSIIPPPLSLIEDRAVSPNKTCGLTGAGLNNGFTCPDTDACCSQYGFCGTGDSFCLTSAGCQASYSNNPRTSCTAPRSGTTVSVDGTCGTTGAGKAGYRCPATGATCCSAYGFCGNTTDHCSAANGCQAGFGTCTAKKMAKLI